MTDLKPFDLTPTPRGYERQLRFIIENVTDVESVAYAKAELERIQPALESGHWTKDGKPWGPSDA